MAATLEQITQELIEAVHPHAGGHLTRERQFELLGDETAQLTALPADARVRLLGHGLLEPSVVAESPPEDLAPVLRLGKKRGRITEERYAAALTPEVQASLPFAAVLSWLSEGEWTQQAADGPNRLRAALLSFVLLHLDTMAADVRAQARRTLVSLVFNALTDEANRNKLVAVLRDAREPNANVDDLILKHFAPLEIAACAKPAWNFLKSALELIAEAAPPSSQASAGASASGSTDDRPAASASA